MGIPAVGEEEGCSRLESIIVVKITGRYQDMIPS